MAVNLTRWLATCSVWGVSEDTAIALAEWLDDNQEAVSTPAGSDPGRVEPEPVFVAVYCELAGLGRLQETLYRSTDLRARPSGIYRAGKEFALWGQAASLSAWFGALTGDRTGCQLVISLRDEIATFAVQTGLVAEGGKRQ